MKRRAHPRHPIRLRVAFTTARALVCEYTTSVSKGGCSVRSSTPVDVGLSFVFELAVEGQPHRKLEVEGRVVHTTARKDGGYDVGVEYAPVTGARQVETARFLDEVFAEQLAKRKHARVPVNLVAEDLADANLRYLVRDLSKGGMGLRLPADRALPPGLAAGDRAELQIWHDGDAPFVFGASVARVQDVAGRGSQASVGLCFDELSEANQRLVDALLYLHRPRSLRLRFLNRPAPRH